MLSHGFTLRYDDPLSQYLPKNLEGLSCFYRSNCIWEAVLVSEQVLAFSKACWSRFEERFGLTRDACRRNF